MNALGAAKASFSLWIDIVAGVVTGWHDRVASPRFVKLIEDESGEFIVQFNNDEPSPDAPAERIRIVDGQFDAGISPGLAAILPGSRVELVLQPNRFIFRPIELPAQARDFLAGIVQTQIDRLTPWNAGEAAFGWGVPIEDGAGRMVINIAATAKSFVRPYIQAIASFGANSISVFTSPPDAGAASTPIKVCEEKARGSLDVDRIRKSLVLVLMSSGIVAGLALAASVMVGSDLDEQRQDIERRIAIASKVARAQRVSAPTLTAQQQLVQQKNESPSSVMVLEALSRILPDHTYVTEFRVEGSKVRLVGITKDAPSLIGLLEQSGYFASATFFAPTTRSPAEPGERFHLEAVIQSYALLRS